MRLSGGKLEQDDVLWLLGSLCSLHRIPFDPDLVAGEFPPPYTRETLPEAARALGFKTGTLILAGVAWGKLPLPAIGFLAAVPQVVNPPTEARSAEEGAAHDKVAGTPVLILKADGHKLLFFRGGSQTPETISIEEVGTRFEAELILISREASGTNKDDEIPGFMAEKTEFGFKWFIPELLKHKTIWRDVLLASLAIQLVGLATPLFTQVIIDKVVVHQANSTLIVLGVALLMFMLFTSTMSWLRQYLVLHTGNRIDAVLGSQVFRHLLRLPLPYFENRPTGTLVARLHGVETIREFVSSAAVKLVLDFPFLLIFLAVMFGYSWQLSLIAVGLLGTIAFISFLVAPVFRDKLNQQFMLGARNQPFLAQYLAAGFSTKQVGNTYNVISNALDQVMTLAILVVGALPVMQNDVRRKPPRGANAVQLRLNGIFNLCASYCKQ